MHKELLKKRLSKITMSASLSAWTKKTSNNSKLLQKFCSKINHIFYFFFISCKINSKLNILRQRQSSDFNPKGSTQH